MSGRDRRRDRGDHSVTWGAFPRQTRSGRLPREAQFLIRRVKFDQREYRYRHDGDVRSGIRPRRLNRHRQRDDARRDASGRCYRNDRIGNRLRRSGALSIPVRQASPRRDHRGASGEIIRRDGITNFLNRKNSHARKGSRLNRVRNENVVHTITNRYRRFTLLLRGLRRALLIRQANATRRLRVIGAFRYLLIYRNLGICATRTIPFHIPINPRTGLANGLRDHATAIANRRLSTSSNFRAEYRHSQRFHASEIASDDRAGRHRSALLRFFNRVSVLYLQFFVNWRRDALYVYLPVLRLDLVDLLIHVHRTNARPRSSFEDTLCVGRQVFRGHAISCHDRVFSFKQRQRPYFLFNFLARHYVVRSLAL